MLRSPHTALRKTAAGDTAAPDQGPNLALKSIFPWVVLLFAAFRLFAALVLRPGGYVTDTSDFGYYYSWGLLSDRGFLPYRDYWVEYPPLIPLLSVVIYRLTAWLPKGDSWGQPDMWFRMALGLVFGLADVGNLILTYRLAFMVYKDERRALMAGLTYALAFVPLYVMLGHMDVLPLFFLLFALDLTFQGRALAGGVIAGLGVMVKLFPAVAVLGVSKKRRRWLCGMALGLTLIAGPLLALWPEWFLASFRAMSTRQPWESIWALAQGYYSFGTLRGSHFSVADSLQPGIRFSGAYLASATALGLCTLYLARRAWLSTQAFGLLSCVAFALSAMLAVYPGFSPQFMVWLVPFAAILLSPKRGVCAVIWLATLALMERVLYFSMLPDSSWILILGILARTATFLLLALMFAARLSPWHGRVWLSSKGRRALAIAATLALLVGGAVLAHVLSRDLLSRYSRLNRYAFAIDRISSLGRPTDALIVTSADSLVSVRPHLDLHSIMLLTHEDIEDQARWKKAQAKLDITLQQHQHVWLLLDSNVALNSDLHTFPIHRVATTAYPFYEQWLASGQWLGGLLLGEPDRWQLLPGADFDNGMVLATCEMEDEPVAAGGSLRFRLTWRHLPAEKEQLSVFLHLAGKDGKPLAQRDALLPASATPDGGDVQQRLGLMVPSAVPPGQYSLIVGVYNTTSGQRIQTAAGNDSIVLASVEVAPQ